MEVMRKVFVLMQQMARLIHDLASNDEGQAVIEYVLMVSVTVAATGALAFGLRKTLFAIWQTFAKDITAACPGCPADPSIRLK